MLGRIEFESTGDDGTEEGLHVLDVRKQLLYHGVHLRVGSGRSPD